MTRDWQDIDGFTEDASKPAPMMKALLTALAGDPEQRYRDLQELIIRKIESGASLYGCPPLVVAECREIIAEREQLTETLGDPFLKSRRVA